MAFGYYKTVTIDHTKVPATQSNFPFLVYVTDAELKYTGNGGYVANIDGFDIRAYSDLGTTTISFELEKYDPVTGELAFWILISSVSQSVDTVFYLFFGDVALNTNASSTAVWDSNFKGVWHLKDGTTLSVADSTANANHGTNHSATAAAGNIDGAGSFVRASGQYVDLSNGLNFAAITMSLWVNPTTLPETYNPPFVRNKDNSTYNAIYIKSTGKLAPYIKATSVIYYDGTGSAVITTGNWHHIFLSYDSSAGLKCVVNGTQDAAISANGAIDTTASQMAIGKSGNQSTFFDGLIDEVHLSNIARSNNWGILEYRDQRAGQDLYTVSGATPVGGGTVTGALSSDSITDLLAVGSIGIAGALSSETVSEASFIGSAVASSLLASSTTSTFIGISDLSSALTAASVATMLAVGQGLAEATWLSEAITSALFGSGGTNSAILSSTTVTAANFVGAFSTSSRLLASATSTASFRSFIENTPYYRRYVNDIASQQTVGPAVTLSTVADSDLITYLRRYINDR